MRGVSPALCSLLFATVMTKQLDAAVLVLDGTPLASFQHCYFFLPYCQAERRGIVLRNVKNDEEMYR